MSAPVALRDNVVVMDVTTSQIGGVPLAPVPGWKRSFDVIVALTGLTLLSPLLVLIAIAISLESPGAPIFRQSRVGQGGRVFTIWKFRSMRIGAEALLATLQAQNEATGHIFKMKDDPRKTRVGNFLRKTSLDELPQLWNILNGSMSCVGPRPPTTYEVAEYDDFEMGRLAARPGVTGLWQVTKRGEHNFADMVSLDVEYARRVSLGTDLNILVKTIPTVLRGKGSV